MMLGQSKLGFILLFGFAFFIACGSDNEKQDVLEQKLKQMMDWSQRNYVIKLNAMQFKTYVVSRPRNYSVIVIFTAMNPKRKCKVCGEADYEFTLLANAFRASPSYSNAVFFAQLDYDEGSSQFELLRLKKVPAFVHFPAKGRRKVGDTYDIRGGVQAHDLAKWMAERTGFRVRVFRPPNVLGTLIAAVFFLATGIFFFVDRSSLDVFWDPNLWGSLLVFVVLVMTSGQMWNIIRGAPYYRNGRHTGEMTFVYRGTRSQVVAETHIVMLLHALITLGFILLHKGGSSSGMDIKHRRAFSLLGLTMILLFFTALVSIFRMKRSMYPYGLLFL